MHLPSRGARRWELPLSNLLDKCSLVAAAPARLAPEPSGPLLSCYNPNPTDVRTRSGTRDSRIPPLCPFHCVFDALSWLLPPAKKASLSRKTFLRPHGAALFPRFFRDVEKRPVPPRTVRLESFR